MKPYNPSNIPLARRLRKEMTPWERKLWYLFLRSHPVRFYRQKTIGEYIVDFYCARAHLVIELDGSGHFCGEQPQRDLKRTQALEQMQLKVLRITNLDIERNFQDVCAFIDMEVRKSLISPVSD